MKPLSDRELDSMYQEFLDDVYPDCSIAGYNYSTSLALREVDPTAYRCGFNDWLDAEVSDERLYERDGEYFTECPDCDDDGGDM